MTFKTLILAGITGLGFGSAAAAFDQSIIDTIAAELAGQGFTRMEVKIGPNGAKIEAQGPNGEIERYYDATGNLLREDVGSGSGGGFGGGNGAGSGDGSGGGHDFGGSMDDDDAYDDGDDYDDDDGFGGDSSDDDHDDDSSDDDGDDDSSDDDSGDDSGDDD